MKFLKIVKLLLMLAGVFYLGSLTIPTFYQVYLENKGGDNSKVFSLEKDLTACTMQLDNLMKED